ncbi:hypothetical protein [Clostridium beijerinckii]|uniref:Uncharacterized protein n=2 Tax=Clostridium beijerinckii TaxID=1520 RepID=A0A9Q5D1Z3_CLOBE|nr:hypothetical protein [Clostridium beijerinckii]AQS04015.1 hypothetical protein CLBIJ_14300 [Clostridium beijerinckii]MBA2884102.1 hypothetical protein [Clostridium beijerinckii]MBA2899285.1 hypothetical protein [Clostridium beijerinckii]MBA2908687.1 hypothetical protein [Clostridium beijerinckii]MBA9016439.1 hypothetical protein [Clostridium beijerinckii]
MLINYFAMLKKVREIRRNYKNLSIDEKLNLLALELKLEGKQIKANDCHTKAEKKSLKSKAAIVRKHNEQKKGMRKQ